MDIDERLQEMESNINYLLTQIEGKSKLIQLVDVLQEDNEKLSLRRSKLIREKSVLSKALSSEKFLTKKLQLRLDDEKNLILLAKFSEISVLLNDADLLINNLVTDFQID